jgi:hypothetical protein
MDRLRIGSAACVRAAAIAVALFLIAPGVARAQCTISGPTTVGTQQSFSLCGPSAAGYRYEWYGPMVPGPSTSRCLTIDGLERGTYEYVLVISDSGDREIDRCRHVVNVGGSTGGVSSCTITGPGAIPEGSTAELCASASAGLHTYEWSGPGNFTATTACIRVSRAGTYTLTTRNQLTNSRRTCTHVLTVTSTGNPSGDCGSLGPAVIDRGASVRLCAPSYASTNYRWVRPDGTTSTTRCITATTTGTYSVTLTNRTTGATRRCTHLLSWSDDSGDWGDPDAVVSDNCPRTLQYWVAQCAGRGAAANDRIGPAEMRALAAAIDAGSRYFNWTNDVNGLCQALNPVRPMTQRKRLARQYAALLANVAAGERNAYDGDNSIGLDVDTPISVGSANTIRELMDQTETMLSTGRGNFNRMANAIAAINAGRGIGTTCE